MMFAFGLGFQMPVVLMFLAQVGLATPEAMWKYWRHAILGDWAFGGAADPFRRRLLNVRHRAADGVSSTF
jgi:Sec-independent protein secretion pathway component TatC